MTDANLSKLVESEADRILRLQPYGWDAQVEAWTRTITAKLFELMTATANAEKSNRAEIELPEDIRAAEPPPAANDG